MPPSPSAAGQGSLVFATGFHADDAAMNRYHAVAAVALLLEGRSDRADESGFTSSD
ncbi:MAG: hypothetical protein ACJAYU_000322 [Bradymonadia bacterium]|jgi:hypothetical protein